MTKLQPPKTRIRHLNEKYGHLFLLECVGVKPGTSRHHHYRCLCDCGRETCKPINEIKRVTSRPVSCGHPTCPFTYRQPKTPKVRKASEFWQYVYVAREKNLPFTLSRDEVFRLFSEPCHYCGAPPPPDGRNGIDKLTPQLGYTKENAVSCCWPCNSAKGARTKDNFLNHIKAIYTHTYLQE